MQKLNRCAVVVRPRQPFLDWVRGVDLANRELTMTDLGNDPSVYLLPECNFEHELLANLKESSREMFEQELESWDRVEEDWPEDRSFKVFQRWFEYSVHWMIFDMADEPIVLEDM